MSWAAVLDFQLLANLLSFLTARTGTGTKAVGDILKKLDLAAAGSVGCGLKGTPALAADLPIRPLAGVLEAIEALNAGVDREVVGVDLRGATGALAGLSLVLTGGLAAGLAAGATWLTGLALTTDWTIACNLAFTDETMDFGAGAAALAIGFAAGLATGLTTGLATGLANGLAAGLGKLLATAFLALTGSGLATTFVAILVLFGKALLGLGLVADFCGPAFCGTGVCAGLAAGLAGAFLACGAATALTACLLTGLDAALDVGILGF